MQLHVYIIRYLTLIASLCFMSNVSSLSQPPQYTQGMFPGSKSVSMCSDLSNSRGRAPKRIPLRKKRALNFPMGTTLQFGVCYFPFVVGTHGLFNFGITLGSNWDVPDSVYKYKYPGLSQIRREKRSLLGLHGEHCVLRALCQLSRRRRNNLQPPSSRAPSFLQALLHVLLHYPSSSHVTEPQDRYDAASTLEDCETVAQLFS
ncbi:hypothetical protein M8J76_011761 [Diaphorina citri]|nr:hypothetical protein M8J75_014467 [Diaphorina citri]KAI5722667.1 hypothetical protein M8J76_011761 [Diaphorina citri]